MDAQGQVTPDRVRGDLAAWGAACNQALRRQG